MRASSSVPSAFRSTGEPGGPERVEEALGLYRARYGATGLAGVGAFGWGGAYGTVYQVDPESRTVIVLMLQLMPNSTDVQQKYLNSVYQALVDQ